MPKTYGYARVSTGAQDLTVQREALIKAGVKPDLIFAEKVAGTQRDGREKLALLLGLADEGDTIVVTRIDRLARSMHDLQVIARELKEKGVALKATEQPIDTGTAAGKAFFDMLGVFAEFETNLRRERQAEGITRAKRQGVYQGGVARIDRAAVKAALDRGLGPAKAARELGISRRQVYRIIQELATHMPT
ncbi:MAG: recombinase family protein [Hyphomicrobiaceae bacterium]